MSVAPIEKFIRPLTPRQEQVRQLRAGGVSRAGIAEKLGIAIGTVDSHLSWVRFRGYLRG